MLDACRLAGTGAREQVLNRFSSASSEPVSEHLTYSIPRALSLFSSAATMQAGAPSIRGLLCVFVYPARVSDLKGSGFVERWHAPRNAAPHLKMHGRLRAARSARVLCPEADPAKLEVHNI